MAGSTHVNLSRQEEVEDLSSPNCAEVTVRDSDVLATYCMACGIEAARTKLSQLGLKHEHNQAVDNPCLCALCGICKIDKSAWHKTLSLTIDRFNAATCSFETLDEPIAVAACSSCALSFVELCDDKVER